MTASLSSAPAVKTQATVGKTVLSAPPSRVLPETLITEPVAARATLLPAAPAVLAVIVTSAPEAEADAEALGVVVPA